MRALNALQINLTGDRPYLSTAHGLRGVTYSDNVLTLSCQLEDNNFENLLVGLNYLGLAFNKLECEVSTMFYSISLVNIREQLRQYDREITYFISPYCKIMVSSKNNFWIVVFFPLLRNDYIKARSSS